MIVERLDPFTTDDVGNRALHVERYAWAAKRVQREDVLDIACGVGYGSAMLADANPGARLTGVDRSQEAIAVAKERHGSERVRFEAIEDAETASLGERRFDTAVSLETLEHLPHPVLFLKRMHDLLRPGARLIVSAPVREHPGDNPFHFHCFRKDTLRALVSEGFKIEEELDQLDAYLTVVARRRDEPALAWRLAEAKEPARLTIVLVTHNGLERVLELVSALRAYTRTPHEIFVVDNASTDGTREYLSILDGDPLVKLVKKPKNEQCAAATNLALAATRTEYVIYLCASHALVTDPGWEEPLVRFLDENKNLEIAGHVWNPRFALESRRYAPGWTPERHGIDKLEHVQGGAWIARRILFDENGFFDQEKYPHGGMDVEFSYRLLSYGKPLGKCPAISCPPSPERPARREGVTVYHPASRALRAQVRAGLGLSPVPEETTIELKEIDQFLYRPGEIGLFTNGDVLVRASAPGAGLITKASFQDVQVKGRVSFGGYPAFKLRLASENDPEAKGYEVVLGPGANFLARDGKLLGRFSLEGASHHFVFEARHKTISFSLDGRRVLEVEDDSLKEGRVFVGVHAGEAIFSGVTIEPLAR